MCCKSKCDERRAVVVVQLAERSLPIPDVRGSKPVTGEILMTKLTVNCWKDENKEKEAGNGPIRKSMMKLEWKLLEGPK